MQDEQPDRIEPPGERKRRRTVDPWDQWGIGPRIVFASLPTEAEIRAYIALDRLGKKKHGWSTARDLVEQDPNLTPKSALRGMHGCAVTGFDHPDFEIAIIGATKQVSVAVAP